MEKTANNYVCPMCEKGYCTETLTLESYLYEHYYPYVCWVKYSVCDQCGSEISNNAQNKFNAEQTKNERNRLGLK